MARVMRRNDSIPTEMLAANIDKIIEDIKHQYDDIDELLYIIGTLSDAGYQAMQSASEEAISRYQVGALALVRVLESNTIPEQLRGLMDKYTLLPIEMYLMLILICSAVGVGVQVDSIEGIQQLLPEKVCRKLEIARLFLPDATLAANGLIELQHRGPFRSSCISVSRNVIDPILRKRGHLVSGWDCASQEDLLKKLPQIQAQFFECVNTVDSVIGTDDEQYVEHFELKRLVGMFLRSIKSEWKLGKLFNHERNFTENGILIALLNKAVWGMEIIRLRHDMRSENAYTGEWLAKAVAPSAMEVGDVIESFLMPSSELIVKELIRPVNKTAGDMIGADTDSIRNMEFELTDCCLDEIGIERKKTNRTVDGAKARDPLVTFDQLILSQEITDALQLVSNQYNNRDVFRKWNMSKTFPYGNAIALLFCGPPGVGKTASAEAVADMLGKQILVADYSQLQSSWVGATEKNITALFREARENDCVLFWDEADAMFYDRDSANRNWEVRHVNVLLQELERFDGVCILSTNRDITLDKALARRISLKLEFKRPTREQVRQIWCKLLPPDMPLAPDVDLALLSEKSLSGGEIKNIVLNAARRASGRGDNAVVTMADFLWAFEMEYHGKGIADNNRCLGFHQSNTA